MAMKETLKEQAQTVNNSTDGDVEIIDKNDSVYIRIHNRCPLEADRLIRNEGWLVSIRTCDNEYFEIYHSYSPYSP